MLIVGTGIGLAVIGGVGFFVGTFIGTLIGIRLGGAYGDDLVDGHRGDGFGFQRLRFGHAIDIRDVIHLGFLAIDALLADLRLAFRKIGVDDGLCGVWHYGCACFLAMRHAPYAQDSGIAVLFDAHTVLFVQHDAFGVKNGGRGQFAVGGHGSLAVRNDGDRAILIDDQSAGELVVHIVDVDGDFCGVVLVFLEKSQQLVGTGGHGPEGNGRAVDVDSGLVGGLYGDHGMIGELVAGRGSHDIVGLDIHPLFLQKTGGRHRICGDLGGLPVDVQGYGFTRGERE